MDAPVLAASFEHWVELAGKVVDGAGVLVLIVGMPLVTVVLFLQGMRAGEAAPGYAAYRRAIGRVILLGLEILVAADIIRSVAITPTFESIGVLGLLVVVRTVLSFSLEVELQGRWPWQRGSTRERSEGVAEG